MKKMIKIAFVAAFAAIAGYGVYANQKSEVLSDLTLANVEALAGSGETTIEEFYKLKYCSTVVYMVPRA